MTSTINLSFGSKVMDARTGIILNNEMDDFSSPNVTNAFGLRPTRNNFIRPGKRPLSSAVPTIVERDGRLEMVVGASGGSKITTAVAQAILNVLDWRMNVQEAISYARLHHQLLPGRVRVEHGLPAEVVTALRERGHQVEALAPGTTLADVQAVVRLPSGRVQAGADLRKGGRAVAY